MTKRESGSLGGRATVARHGKSHMADLARRWHDKYALRPYNGNDFLIVNRQSGAINPKTLNGDRYSPRQK